MDKKSSALLAAAKTGDLAALADALHSGADINAKSNSGRTAAMLVTESGNQHCLALLRL